MRLQLNRPCPLSRNSEIAHTFVSLKNFLGTKCCGQTQCHLRDQLHEETRQSHSWEQSWPDYIFCYNSWKNEAESYRKMGYYRRGEERRGEERRERRGEVREVGWTIEYRRNFKKHVLATILRTPLYRVASSNPQYDPAMDLTCSTSACCWTIISAY